MRQKKRAGARCLRGMMGVAAVLMLCLCLSISAMAATARENVADEGKINITEAVVSPALHILAARSDMAVATLCGNAYYFSGDVFARALNMDATALRYITVGDLPASEEGTLMIGSTQVSEGQVIAAANLSMLSYVAADDTVQSEGSFTFSANGAGYDMTCSVHVLEELNYSPTLRIATDASLQVSTYRNYAGYGTLAAYDPEGDALTYEIVSRPKHGLVILTDESCGEYVYLPRLGFRGGDSFSYVVRDCYGNYSASAEVKVTVNEPAIAVDYADMTGRRDYNAALAMAECGIMQGTESEGKTYFYPEETVSRADFLVMAMQAIGVSSVPTVNDTGFSDDSEIDDDIKGYVAAAYSLEYIKGSSDAQGELCFLPNEQISRAEAAVILRRMVDADAPELTPAFADASDIPAWASEAISTLSSLGVMTGSGGAISPNEMVTRGQTAMMLSALRRVAGDQ